MKYYIWGVGFSYFSIQDVTRFNGRIILELLGSIEHETPCNREKIYLVAYSAAFSLEQKMVQNMPLANMSIIISERNAEGSYSHKLNMLPCGMYEVLGMHKIIFKKLQNSCFKCRVVL